MRHVEQVNPRHDVDFVTLVDTLATKAASPEELERQLRRTHPRAVVRKRGLHAEAVEIWYVYRDGTWTPNRPPAEATGA